MVTQKRGLVNGVVPVLQPVAVRAIHPGGAVSVGGPVDVAVGRLDVVVVVIGLVGEAGGAGEAVIGVGHLADAEEGVSYTPNSHRPTYDFIQ